MGKADTLKLGDWNAICDKCGMKRKASTLRKNWEGFMVCADTCWEPRHESDFFRIKPDNQNVPWTRPEQADSSGTDIAGNTTRHLGNVILNGDVDKTLEIDTDPNVQQWDTALTANRTVTLSTTNAKKGDRFTVYRTGGGAFTLDVGGLVTGPASVEFVAVVEFNGVSWGLESYTPLGL